MSENPSTPSKGRRSDDVAAHHVSPATQPPTPQLPSTLYETRERNIAENDAFIAALFGYSPVSYNTTPSSAKKRRRGNFENEHNAYHSRAGSVSKVPRLSLGRAAKEGAKKHVAPSSDESASAEVEEKGLGGSEKEATKDKGKGKESVNKNAGGDPDFAI